VRFRLRQPGGLAHVQDYLILASEVEDLAAWMPDQQLAASYRRLADSYQRLARFNDQLTALLINYGDDRDPLDAYRLPVHDDVQRPSAK
jgi:hypothetical protein